MPATKFRSKFKGRDFGDVKNFLSEEHHQLSMKSFHEEMQKVRSANHDVTLRSYLSDIFGPEMTPEKFYSELGVEISGITVGKMLETSELSRWLLPELFRDAIRKGLNYAPFYSNLVALSENINGMALTMPALEYSGDASVKLRDSSEAATITEGTVAWSEKQVSIKKKARGLRQSYEAMMFVPVNLAAVYFEDMGTRLGADLDKDVINTLLNGDQSDGSEAAPLIGVTTASVLSYKDLVRAWVRMQRIGRPSTSMLMSEDNALAVLDMDAFKRVQFPGGEQRVPVTLNWRTPLPTSQDIFVHSNVPTNDIIFVDTTKAIAQLTAMPLLIESDKIVNRQVLGEFASIITGFANIFTDARLVMDVSTNLLTNPGPTIPI